VASGGGEARPEGTALVEDGPRYHPVSECFDTPQDCEGIGSVGELDPRVVVRAVGRLRGAMTRCYERQLTAGSPDLRGSVDVAFDIEESGEVSHVRAVEDTTGSADLAQCLVAAFRRMPRFHPGPVGGSVSFRFPIVFEPAD
jgi:TonB family protein